MFLGSCLILNEARSALESQEDDIQPLRVIGAKQSRVDDAEETTEHETKKTKPEADQDKINHFESLPNEVMELIFDHLAPVLVPHSPGIHNYARRLKPLCRLSTTCKRFHMLIWQESYWERPNMQLKNTLHIQMPDDFDPPSKMDHMFRLFSHPDHAPISTHIAKIIPALQIYSPHDDIQPQDSVSHSRPTIVHLNRLKLELFKNIKRLEITSGALMFESTRQDLNDSRLLSEMLALAPSVFPNVRKLHISFSFNYTTGVDLFTPIHCGQLCTYLSQLQHLETLDLSQTFVTGHMPDLLHALTFGGRASSLKHLILNYSHVNESDLLHILNNIKNSLFPQLEALDLSYNTLPVELGRHSLQTSRIIQLLREIKASSHPLSLIGLDSMFVPSALHIPLLDAMQQQELVEQATNRIKQFLAPLGINVLVTEDEYQNSIFYKLH